ncbi:Fe(3+) ABC transporter substrate-binding protein [Vallitalea pronyensis]|uniref:Fe(3+) ABC transporter substrate-binding protein n=2 Tax=Vallitalea pronyensis TaxID=1348613 RepID=A0A8J8MPM9_9FIRM|nr:Fe(3+) ABC transporter substrate-binding protein [Vallitalea pronyensis]
MIKMVSVLLGLIMLVTGCKINTEDKSTGQDKVITDDTAIDETQNDDEKESDKEQEKTIKEQVVNLYTDRHYDTDEALYNKFTEETGIQVNIVKGKSDELIERLVMEDADTHADLLITADAGRLHRAKTKGLLQTVENDALLKNVPVNLRDNDNQWFALTVRARVIVYAKDRIDPTELSTYADLTQEKWENRILVRSSTNIYNQSLLASFIAIGGEEKAKEWAKGIVGNMARKPQGNDRAQATAVVAGEGDLAIMNTYYIGKMLNSSDVEEVNVAEQVGIFFPDQDGQGTHINVSGMGLTKHSKHSENAIKLMKFLTGELAQEQYANANYEYPVNVNVEPSALLKSWGDFKAQDIDLSLLGEYNSKATRLFNEVDWQ